jgi:hypothetical protein
MIKPVYRVQCDGPGREWLALSDDPEPGTNLMTGVLIATPIAQRAGVWASEKAAKVAAVGAGWRHPVDSSDFKDWLCPTCQSVGPGEAPAQDA